MWGLLAVAVALVAIGVFGFALWTMRVLNRATVLLYRGDPDAFLEAVEELRPWTFTRRGHELLALNEAVGFFWKGAFARALAKLAELDASRMNRLTRAAHDACLISSLVMLGRVAEASTVYAERAPSLRKSGHPLTELMCDTIEADLALYGRSDLDEARRLCERLLVGKRLPRIALASIRWTLAEIAERQGRDGEAREHARVALDLAGATFIAALARALRSAPRPQVDVPEGRDSLVPVAVPATHV